MIDTASKWKSFECVLNMQDLSIEISRLNDKFVGIDPVFFLAKNLISG